MTLEVAGLILSMAIIGYVECTRFIHIPAILELNTLLMA